MTRPPLAAVAALILAATLAGCGGSDKPAAAPTTAAAPTSTGPDAHAQRACAMANAASAVGSDSDPEAMLSVAEEAKRSTDPRISRAGVLLGEYVKLAAAAKGASDEQVMRANLTAKAFGFVATCAEAGFVR